MVACCIAFAFLHSLKYLACNSQVRFKEGVISYETLLMGGGGYQICTGEVIKASLLFTNIIYRKLTLGHYVLIMCLETNQRWFSFCSFNLSHEPAFKGWEATRRMGVAATPKCKENAYWKNKERAGGVWELRSRILLSPRPFRWLQCNHYPIQHYKFRTGVWGLPPEKCLEMYFQRCWKMPFCKLIQGCQKNPLVKELYGSNYLNLSG